MRESTVAVSTRSVSKITVLLVVTGTVDYGNYDTVVRAAEAALDEGLSQQVVDLSGVHLCDSSGLRALLVMQRHARERGGWLRLAAPSNAVATVLGVTGLDRALPVYDALDAALPDD